jgi:hypothetical protein
VIKRHFVGCFSHYTRWFEHYTRWFHHSTRCFHHYTWCFHHYTRCFHHYTRWFHQDSYGFPYKKVGRIKGASVTQSSHAASAFHLWVRFSMRTPVNLCEKSQSTLHQKSWVFSEYSGFLPQGMLTGWVGIIPQIDPSTVAVLRDQTWVIRWLPEAPLESLRLDQVELRPSQFSLALSCK